MLSGLLTERLPVGAHVCLGLWCGSPVPHPTPGLCFSANTHGLASPCSVGLPSHWPLSTKPSGTVSANADLYLEHWLDEGCGFTGLGSGSLRNMLLGSFIPSLMRDLCLKAVPRLAKDSLCPASLPGVLSDSPGAHPIAPPKLASDLGQPAVPMTCGDQTLVSPGMGLDCQVLAVLAVGPRGG